LEIESFCNGQVSMLNNPVENINKEVLMAAVISECENRMTKNNEPFGTMVIEDYTDSYKLFLFRENYLKFKPFFVPGTFVSIKGKFEIPRHRKEPEFVIQTMELLHDLKEKRANTIQLKISNKKLNQIMIQDLNRLFLENEGRCAVKFVIYDPLENLEVTLPSKNIRIDPNNDFVKRLKEFDLEFELMG